MLNQFLHKYTAVTLWMYFKWSIFISICLIEEHVHLLSVFLYESAQNNTEYKEQIQDIWGYLPISAACGECNAVSTSVLDQAFI